MFDLILAHYDVTSVWFLVKTNSTIESANTELTYLNGQKTLNLHDFFTVYLFLPDCEQETETLSQQISLSEESHFLTWSNF